MSPLPTEKAPTLLPDTMKIKFLLLLLTAVFQALLPRTLG